MQYPRLVFGACEMSADGGADGEGAELEGDVAVVTFGHERWNRRHRAVRRQQKKKSERSKRVSHATSSFTAGAMLAQRGRA